MSKDVVVIPAEQVYERSGKKSKTLRVAAYCRVSTDEEKQLGSFDNQIEYFTHLIAENGKYELVNIYNPQAPNPEFDMPHDSISISFTLEGVKNVIDAA